MLKSISDQLQRVKENTPKQNHSTSKPSLPMRNLPDLTPLAIAVALGSLGRLYRDQEQFNLAQAEPLFKQALAIREKSLGPDHPDTAATLSDLSLLYFYEHKFAEAEQLGERALAIDEKAYGPEGLQVATDLDRVGIAQRDQQKFGQAEIASNLPSSGARFCRKLTFEVDQKNRGRSVASVRLKSAGKKIKMEIPVDLVESTQIHTGRLS